MDWKQIIERGETSGTDFKAACKWDGDYRVKLTKDIAAMANTRDGGNIIIGIDEDRRAGPTLTGLSADQLASFDVTKVGEYVNSRFAPDIRVRVERPIVDGKPLIVIVVNEFDEQPHVCTKEGVCNGKKEFLPGQLLIRTAAAQSTVVGAQELRELLGRAISRKGDNLLEQVRRIVSGVPTPPRKKEAQELFQQELNKWSASVAEVSKRSPHGGWSFVVMPLRKPDEPLSHRVLRSTIARASFDLRGWSFPAVPISEVSNRASGISGDAKFDGFVEHWELFGTLLFGDFRSFWEDTLWLKDGTPGTELSFVNAIYSVAEFVLFAKRLLAELSYEGEVVLQIRLLGCDERKLVSKEWARSLHGEYKSCEKEIVVAQTVHTTDLAAGWEEQAVDLVQEIFALFNWSDPDRQMILEDIAKLRDRRT